MKNKFCKCVPNYEQVEGRCLMCGLMIEEHVKNKEKRSTPRRREKDKKLTKAYNGLRRSKSIIDMLDDVKEVLNEL